VLLVHVTGVAKFLADKAFVREVSTVEVTVTIRLVRVDILDGGFSEGRDDFFGGIAGRPDVRAGVRSVGGCGRMTTRIGRER
jgi:hypothetical protein